MLINYLQPTIKNSVKTPITESFNNLPCDPYLPTGCRKRTHSRFLYDSNSKHLSKLPHQAFVQSNQDNYLFGDLKRDFAELEREVAESEDLRLLITSMADSCGLTAEKVEIGVHQIRTSCSPTTLGEPAPEGVHQDGYEFVGIYCLARENVMGGVTMLYQAKDSQPFFQEILNPGELLVFNDEQLFHFTSPIRPTSDTVSFRDVFILTAKQTR